MAIYIYIYIYICMYIDDMAQKLKQCHCAILVDKYGDVAVGIRFGPSAKCSLFLATRLISCFVVFMGRGILLAIAPPSFLNTPSSPPPHPSAIFLQTALHVCVVYVCLCVCECMSAACVCTHLCAQNNDILIHLFIRIFLVPHFPELYFVVIFSI